MFGGFSDMELVWLLAVGLRSCARFFLFATRRLAVSVKGVISLFPWISCILRT